MTWGAGAGREDVQEGGGGLSEGGGGSDRQGVQAVGTECRGLTFKATH